MDYALLCSCLILGVLSFSRHTVESGCKVAPKLDYYWREYTRIIPHDAVPAGNYSNGTTLYIGQAVLTQNEVIKGIHPVSIHKDYKGALTAKPDLATYNRFIKVLCSPKPQNFEWLRVTDQTFHVCTAGESLVEGGVEQGRILHIARAQYEQESFIGEVSGHNLTHARMYGSFNGTYFYYETFDVLVYRPSLDANCISTE